MDTHARLCRNYSLAGLSTRSYMPPYIVVKVDLHGIIESRAVLHAKFDDKFLERAACTHASRIISS